MAEVTLLNRLGFEPVIKPGYIVHILPDNKYGYYLFPKDSFPEVLPETIVNMASATNRLGAMVDTGSQPQIRNEIDDLDMPKYELAQLRVRVIDDVLVKIFQPAAVGRFNNLSGPLQFNKGSTDMDYQFKDSQLGEIFVFDKETRPTIEVTPTTYRATSNARIGFKGYRYPLVKMDQAPPEGTPAFTLTVEGKSN